MRKISFTVCSVFLVVTSSVFTSGCETGEVKKEEETKGKWTQKADIPGDLRQGAFSFSVAGKGYLGLGQYSGNLHRDLWEYNPDADAWSPKTPFPGTPMAEGGVFVVNQKAYLVAGVIRYATSAQPVRDVWEYDPAHDSWMQKNKFSGAGGVAAGFNAGNTGYIVNGGRLWQYVPETDQWLPNVTIPFRGRVTALSETIYGLSDGNTTTEVWRYSPLADTWHLVSTSSKIKGGVVFGLRGRIFFGSVTFWQYDPADRSWQVVEPFPGPEATSMFNASLDGRKLFVIGEKAYIGTSVNYGKALWEFAY